jgi:WD40 repeat protein
MVKSRPGHLFQAWLGQRWPPRGANRSTASHAPPGTADPAPSDQRANQSRVAAKPAAFISYSRKDIEFVARLNTALDRHGIDVRIDREDIEKSAEWWSRIRQLITEADTIIFVLSPDSVRSSTCQQEVAFAEGLKKRLIPIVVRDLADQSAPSCLARLNYIFFTANAAVGATGDFDSAVEELVWAIETDITWIREHTRLGTLAGRWETLGRPHELELRGQELAKAESWLIARPRHAPDPTDAHRAFIRASQQLAKRQQRVLVSSLSAGVLVFMALAVLAVIRQQQAERQAALALTSASDSSFRSNQQLPALVASIKAAKILKRQIMPVQGPTLLKVLLPLHRAVYGSTERNRFEGQRAQSSEIFSVRYSPDGSMIASGDAGESVILWKADGSIHQKLSFATQLILGLSFSPDGKKIAAIDRGNRVTIWQTLDGQATPQFLSSYTYSGPQLDVGLGTANQQDLNDVWTRLWSKADVDPNTDVAIINKIFAKRGLPVGHDLLRLSPNRTFFVVGVGRSVEMWSVEGVLMRVVGRHDGDVTAIDVHPDGRRFATAGQDHAIKVWQSNGGLLFSIDEQMAGHRAPVEALKFSSDGRSLVSLDRAGVGKVWDARAFSKHHLPVLTDMFVWDAPASDHPPISFSPDGGHFAVGYSSGQIKIWSVEHLQAKTSTHQADGQQACTPYDEAVVEFSPDGRLLITSGCNELRIWDANGNRKAPIAYPDSLQKPLVSISRDGRAFLVSTSNFEQPRLYAHDGNLIKTFGTEGFAALRPAGDAIAIRKGDTVQLQRLNGEIIDSVQLSTIHSQKCSGRLRYSPDGTIVILLGSRSVCLWNVADGTIRLVEGSASRTSVQEARLSGDSRTLALLNGTNAVTLYDLHSGRNPASVVLAGHAASVDSLRFSPDNSMVITASSRDGTIRFWELNGRLIDLINISDPSLARLSKNVDSFGLDLASVGPSGIDMNPRGNTLVSIRGNALTFWNLDLDNLLSLACKHVANYLANPNSNLAPAERLLCKDL